MISKPLHLLFLTKYDRSGASSRYRTYQYLPYLEEAGFKISLSPLFDEPYLEHKYQVGRARFSDIARAFRRRLRALLDTRKVDIVIIEYEIFPYFFALAERWLIRRNIPYILDYDDALFHQYDNSNRMVVRWLLGNKIARVMGGARLVIAGNKYLAEYARRAGAGAVNILPTVIDLARYPTPADRKENKMFTIGWIGSPSTAKYLEQIAPALSAVCADGRARLRLIGAGEVYLPRAPYEAIPWSEADEVAQLQKLDAGIMPLPGSPWERGKCGFKLIQYMACGLPVVASPVVVNAEIVEQGKNGYLASSYKEWVSALSCLRDAAENRRAMGAAGRDKVEKCYSLQVTAPRLVELLQTIVPAQRSNN
jgi:glycosyltransferase involved in cell wall biosynthesis